MTSRRKALKDMSNVKELKTKNAAQADEIESLKAQLADLTSTLNQMSISEKHSEEASDSKASGSVPVGDPVPVHVEMPLAPRRATSAYLFYVKHARAARGDELKGMAVGESSAMIAGWWKNADVSERTPFVKQADEDKARYEREASIYRERKVAAERERKALEEHFHEQKVAAALKFYENHKEGKPLPVEKPVKKQEEDAPKKPKSAYILFAAHRRKVIAESSSEKQPFAEVTRQLADEWNALNGSKTKKAKTVVARYQKLAVADRERYTKEKAAYDERKAASALARTAEFEKEKQAALEAYSKKEHAAMMVERAAAAEKAAAAEAKDEKRKQREQKRAEKEAKAKLPKKPRSAYILFCADKRPQFATKNSTATQPEIMKMLGSAWKAASAAEKAKFDKLAAEDKTRYQREMAALSTASA